MPPMTALHSALPAGPRRIGDWASGLRAAMLHCDCFEAGGLTLTQSSATVSRDARCRKWMSGRAWLRRPTIAKPKALWAQWRSLSLYGLPTGQDKKRAERRALPNRTTTCVAARVALQRCPILRAGKGYYTMNPPWTT